MLRRIGLLGRAGLVIGLFLGVLTVFGGSAIPAGASGTSVSQLSVSISPPTASAPFTTYVFNFVATNGIGQGNGNQINIVAPTGTSFNSAQATLTDNTNPAETNTGPCVDTGNSLNVVGIGCGGLDVDAGNSVTLTVTDVTNTGTPGPHTLTLATVTDANPVTASFTIVTGTVGQLKVQPQPSANGYNDATYVITFIATHGITGGYGPQINIVAPNGTDFGSVGADYTDNSQPADSDNSPCANLAGNNTNTLAIGCGGISASSGDSVTLTLTNVGNPPTPNGYTLTLSTNADPTAVTSAPYVISAQGYWEVAADGGIFSYGNAAFFGSTGSIHLNQPIVGMSRDPRTGGYWFVAADGGIFSFNAPFFGSMGGKRLNAPIVGMAADPATGGYWFVAADGGIFSFNAPFFGSMGGKHLNQPIVGMTSTPDGLGYWFVAADGGIFSFGDAQFYGSTGSIHLNRPIVGMAADDATGGYWFVASDGGVFAFNAPFLGSQGGQSIGAPIVGMSADGTGGGYRFVGSDGAIYAFGNAADEGDPNGPLNQPVVGMASTT